MSKRPAKGEGWAPKPRRIRRICVCGRTKFVRPIAWMDWAKCDACHGHVSRLRVYEERIRVKRLPLDSPFARYREVTGAGRR